MDGLLYALDAYHAIEEAFDHVPTAQADTGNIKACAQCGATKTPQWREGPEGPKTLCNACGVKRCRQVRSATDGKKAETRPAAKQSHHKASKKVKSTHAKTDIEYHQKRARSHADADEAYYPAAKISRPSTPDLHIPTPTSSSNLHRPQRKAAVRAASKTAGFAATGEWHDETISRAAEEAQLMDEASKQAMVETAESMGRSSATAEDLTWHVPSPAPSMAEAVSPVNAIDSDSSAAINLMAMSLRSPQSFRASLRPATSHDYTHHDLKGMTVNQLKDHADDMVANTNLPEAKRDELQSLLGTLHQEEHQVACADAAVSAVAKVLANKQALAIQARLTQQQLNVRLSAYMSDFLSRWPGILKMEP